MFLNDADRLAFIKGLGGQLVRINDVDVWAVYESEFSSVDDGLEMESRAPMLDPCRACDLVGVAKDSPVVVGEEHFRVKRLEPDQGSGMTRVVLKR